MRKTLLSLAAALGFALASVAVVPELPKALKGSWPEGTAFALVDEGGQVVWQPGSRPTREALAQAKALRITLPDGTTYLVAVRVEGEGAGLGEVKLTVDGKTVPLPELLHAQGFALEDGVIVKEKPKAGQKEKAKGKEHEEEHGGKGGKSEDHGQAAGGKGRRP
ncbi:MAG: hypothetical protein ACP5JV_10275 [Thermus sp.]|uniref:hypothetical protein n=1 Tax=Thermus sp. TaxID=275 RepID=UPI003D13E946